VTNTFLGLDQSVNTRYSESEATAFLVSIDENGEHYGEIIFGPDIYPGDSVVDPNSALGIDAAAAHELTHYYRWKDKSAIEDPGLMHLDEALTSLQAISRYPGINETSKRQLVADAVQRLHLYIQAISSKSSA
jgi:hypothetical protein